MQYQELKELVTPELAEKIRAFEFDSGELTSSEELCYEVEKWTGKTIRLDGNGVQETGSTLGNIAAHLLGYCRNEAIKRKYGVYVP